MPSDKRTHSSQIIGKSLGNEESKQFILDAFCIFVAVFDVCFADSAGFHLVLTTKYSAIKLNILWQFSLDVR